MKYDILFGSVALVGLLKQLLVSFQLPQISREFFRAFYQMKELYSIGCAFCQVSRLALRTQVPHRISIFLILYWLVLE